MPVETDQLIAFIAVVVAISVALGKAFGPYQTTLTQWVIDAFGVPGNWRGLVNLAVGLTIATGFSVLAAIWIGAWMLVAVGIFAGFLASVEAGREHDAAEHPP